MDFEKIKNYFLENKKFVLLVGVIVVTFAWFRFINAGDNSQVSETDANFRTTQNTGKKTASNETSSEDQSAANKEVTCDIDGAVMHQGVYTLSSGARLEALIEAAGGLTANAQLKAINRAVILKDQAKIHIPYKGEKVSSATSNMQNSATSNQEAAINGTSEKGSSNKINLNTASSTDLQKLNGIGAKKAEQIIAYRKQNGDFKKIEDLMKVSGIGEKTFAALKDQLAV